ncbi:MAG: hypothetical protein GC200_10840 [Tepidisphaera sp.]|nr:hypothetical protein [Tepidisphaera sp.]
MVRAAHSDYDEPGQHYITCYHCGAQVVAPVIARSFGCPKCHRGIALDDITVKDSGWSGLLNTCGRIFIRPRARTITRNVHAGDGIEVLGVLEANVRSGGPVVVGSRGKLKGQVQATSVWIDPGGTLECPMLRIGPRRT